jgi:PPOX class probable F420-dependent enzyme
VEVPGPILERMLERWPVGRLASSAPDGAPHQVPVVFAWVEGRLWSPIDAKPKTGVDLARVRNIERDPRVSLLLDHYDADWSRLWWVRIDGRAEILRVGDPERDPSVRSVVARLRAKYPAYRDLAVLTDPPTLIRVEPARIRSWCAGPAALEGWR